MPNAPKKFFDITGLDREFKKFRKSLEDAHEGSEHEIARGVWDAADAVLSEAEKEAPVDRGGLRYSGSVAYGPGPTAEVTFKSPYAKPVEFGSRPHMPPVEPLEAWAKRHGMKPGAGWAIAKKIAEKGTRPDPFLQRALDKVLPRLPELIGRRVFGRVVR